MNYVYMCDCRCTEGTFKKTKVNPENLCLYCEHYAVAKPLNTTASKIMKLFKEGYSQRNIAKLLKLKPVSVRYHLLKSKLVKKGKWSDENQSILEKI